LKGTSDAYELPAVHCTAGYPPIAFSSSPRVIQILSGEKPARSAETIRIAVPDLSKHKDARLQLELRDGLVEKLRSDYAITGFEKSLDCAFYQLEKS
jgi:hypothetical protein